MGEMIEQLVRRYEGGKLTRRELVLSLSALVLARPEALVFCGLLSAAGFVATRARSAWATAAGATAGPSSLNVVASLSAAAW